MQEIIEGKARIKVSDGVFFNPKMKKLRDISIAFLNATNSKGRLLDATSATGVRGIRYLKETGIKEAVFLDMNQNAYRNTSRNIKANKLKAKSFYKSFQEFANTNNGRFDVIDIDPFGSLAPYIYDSMKLAIEGSIIMATATDTAVLSGAHEKACMKIYSSRPLHNYLCKEVGTRILLSYIARIAGQFNLGIEPILTISDMHYIRVFIRVRHGAELAVDSVKSSGLATFCPKCNMFNYKDGMIPAVNVLDRKCANCGSDLMMFGPIWLGNLQDKKVIKKMRKINTSEDAVKYLELADKELDVLFFYSIPRMTKILNVGSVSHKQVLDELKKKGFKASETQFEIDSIKTDAPREQVFNIVRTLSKKNSRK